MMNMNVQFQIGSFHIGIQYRFGMSCTVLDDKTIFIGGEHEDYYDPNFCIYNDVIVVSNDNENPTVRVYGYPKDVFPPTDFHCSIVIGDYIWIVGCIGYSWQRGHKIQVCRLHVPSMQMETVVTTGPYNRKTNTNTITQTQNTCTLQDDGTTIKVTVGKFVWNLDTQTCIWTYVLSCLPKK